MMIISNIHKIFKAIPSWAIALVCIVVFTNSVFFLNRFNYPYDGKILKSHTDWHVKSVIEGSPASIGGIRSGDLIYRFFPKDSSLFKARIGFIWGAYKSGDILNYTIIREGKELIIPVTLGSIMDKYGLFYIFMFVFFNIMSISSLFILYKKPGIFAVKLFFICIQLFLILANGRMMFYRDVPANFANAFYWTAAFLTGPLMMHFHLIFPEKTALIKRFRSIPWIFYGLSVFGIFFIVGYYNFIFSDDSGSDRVNFITIERLIPFWYSMTLFIALLIALFQFTTIKNSLAKNQLRIIVLGSSISLILPFIRAFFPEVRTEYWKIIPFIYPDLISGITTIILIICILIAIFRYKIWETGLYISTAFKYIVASAFISGIYLVLIFLADMLAADESVSMRFAVLFISILVFVFLRNQLQMLLDKYYYRKAYNAEVVISEFESRTSGFFDLDILFKKTGDELDRIFHFSSFALFYKQGENNYKQVALIGNGNNMDDQSFVPDAEFHLKAEKSKVFSLYELNGAYPYFTEMKGDLVVPIKSEDQLEGFMVCGPKRSGKVYDHKDIKVLELLAKRVYALVFTSKLYKKDLENQLALNNERNRISRDMHDELGAGLTKITMLCELPSIALNTNEDAFNRLNKISVSARELVSKLNVIIWALNPNYNNLESLIGYIRRYFGDFLENTGIDFKISHFESIPDIRIMPEYRRNVYYSVQEAVNNAVKHSLCTRISIDIALVDGFLEIIIIDNGIGFNPEETRSYRNGISNLKKRAQELDGNCQIISSPGNGCIIKMRFSLP